MVLATGERLRIGAAFDPTILRQSAGSPARMIIGHKLERAVRLRRRMR
jgi:hypothetical protein